MCRPLHWPGSCSKRWTSGHARSAEPRSSGSCRRVFTHTECLADAELPCPLTCQLVLITLRREIAVISQLIDRIAQGSMAIIKPDFTIMSALPGESDVNRLHEIAVLLQIAVGTMLGAGLPSPPSR